MSKKDDEMDEQVAKEIDESDLSGDASTTEEAMGKLIALLSNENKFRVITELTKDEESAIAGLLALAETYDIPLLKNYIKNLLLLRVSRKREGRKEIIQMGVARLKDAMQNNLFKRMGGMMGFGRGGIQ